MGIKYAFLKLICRSILKRKKTINWGCFASKFEARNDIRKPRQTSDYFPALLVVLLLISLTGCATVGQNPSSGIELLSKHAVLLELPFEAQKVPNLCGVASVEMVTRYYGKRLANTQAAYLREEAGENGGVSGATLKKVLEETGYFVAVFPGTLDRGEASLYNHLDLKRPLIVMMGSGPRHYAVVTGYDPDNAMIVLLDPARGQVAVPLQDFLKVWKEANYFTLLASLDQEEGKKK